MTTITIQPSARHQTLKALRVAARILRYAVHNWGALSTRVYDPTTLHFRPATTMEKPENDIYAWRQLAKDMDDVIAVCSAITTRANEAIRILNERQ